MSETSSNELPKLIQCFFLQRLQEQQGVSGHTIASYRDTFRLLLQFVHKTRRRAPCQQRLDHWDAPCILKFLDYLEKERGSACRTRNARLAAIRSFMRWVSQQEPTAVVLASRVLAIPMKRFDRPMLGFLSRAEIKAVLEAPASEKANGLRDRVLFTLLYNTGARISEILNLREGDLTFGPPTVLRLHGKGRKQRDIPLWNSTSAQLRHYLDHSPVSAGAFLFQNRFGQRLGRSGAAKRLRLIVRIAEHSCSSLKGRDISPHTFRHTNAMHLLQAGVDLNVIALLLGHESPSTTHQYIELDLEMKARCLNKIEAQDKGLKRFKPSDRLLAFLESL
jgi:integrase/recombinase XerD